MRKSDGKYFAVFSGIDFDNPIRMAADPKPEILESSLKSVLDEIFSVDPVSGFPKGDIQYYLSSEGNPQVKQWLENNLLKPRLSSSSSSMKDVSDDMIEEFSRKADENFYDFQNRLISLYDDAKAEYEKSLEFNSTENG